MKELRQAVPENTQSVWQRDYMARLEEKAETWAADDYFDSKINTTEDGARVNQGHKTEEEIRREFERGGK